MSWRDAPIVSPPSSSWRDAEIVQPAAAAPEAEPLTRGQRFRMGMMDPITGAAQLLERVTPSPLRDAVNSFDQWMFETTGGRVGTPDGMDALARSREAEYQERRAAAGESGFDGARIAGNVLSPANLPAFRVPLAATTTGRLAQGGALGAVYGAAQPTTGDQEFWTETGTQAAAGAATGALGSAAIGSVSDALGRAATDPAVNLLRNEGVRPTGAQMIGGAAKAAEERARSLPIAGGMINRAQGTALRDYNLAAINRAVRPVGESVDAPGLQGVQRAQDILGRAYDKARDLIRNGIEIDATFDSQMAAARAKSQAMVPAMRRKFNQIVDGDMGRDLTQGRIGPDRYKAIDSNLGRTIRSYRKSQDPTQRELAEALSEVQTALRGQMARTNPEAAALFNQADTGWAHLGIVEGAAEAARNNNGVFTPAQLYRAVRQADSTVNHRGLIRGEALMSDLAQAGQSVLGNRVPDSGTAGRLMYAGLGGLTVHDPLLGGATIAGLSSYGAINPLLRAATSSPTPSLLMREGARGVAPVLGGQVGGAAPGLLSQ